MIKVESKSFKYLLFKPEHNQTESTIILYHGWGTQVYGMSDVAKAKEFTQQGYAVIVPEILYHETRNPLDHPFEPKTLRFL